MLLLVQMAKRELRDGNFGSALQHYELIKTWSPAAAETAIQTCVAAGALPAVMKPVNMHADAQVRQ